MFSWQQVVLCWRKGDDIKDSSSWNKKVQFSLQIAAVRKISNGLFVFLVGFFRNYVALKGWTVTEGRAANLVLIIPLNKVETMESNPFGLFCFQVHLPCKCKNVHLNMQIYYSWIGKTHVYINYIWGNFKIKCNENNINIHINIIRTVAIET